MKAIGVVRRIDDLGRIVIPKELRKTMRIKEGDSLEIFIEGSEKVVLKKYSPVQNIQDIAEEFTKCLNESNDVDVFITDGETIISVAGKYKDKLQGKRISRNMEDRIRNRSVQVIERGSEFEVIDGFKTNKPLIIKSIHLYGDILGSIVIIKDDYISEIDKSLIDFSTLFFNKYLEN